MMSERVVESMNGKDMGGRELIVNEAKPRQDEDVRGRCERLFLLSMLRTWQLQSGR